MTKSVTDGINLLVEKLMKDQSQDGSWNYPFETGISTDCYMIILLRSLEINDEKLIIKLSKRILSKQEENGSWKLFFDENNGNISITVEAYYALLYSGYYEETDARLMRAKAFILAHGGIEKSHMFTKVMLAMTGQMKWVLSFPLPIEVILLPTDFPINFYNFSVFGRANLTPLMILANRKFFIKTERSPDLSELFIQRDDSSIESLYDLHHSNEWRSIFSALEEGFKYLVGLPIELHRLALEQAKQYMIARIEPDGTFYNYFSSTFLMIFALLSLGYSKNHRILVKAINGLKSMKSKINGLPHMQYTDAQVWNTSLISYTLQEAGVSPLHPILKKANEYILNHQHDKYGDWVVHNRYALPGGWGFQDKNTIQPDVDDTTASLRALIKNLKNNKTMHKSWEKGVNWVLSMQNDDGGWPAFEKNTNSKLLEKFPIEKAKFILTDPSSADLTGRTLEFLGTYTSLTKNDQSVRKGARWLLKNQEENGSWYGRWGICYIYGTWAAITGLIAVGLRSTNYSIIKAVQWLTDIQNDDGGWGESCKSDIEGKYVPLKASTLTHTAWAVDALISVSPKPTRAIKSGMKYLLQNLEKEDWTTKYPTGQGMAGDFYVHYHSYQYIFPLLVFSHYKSKYLLDNFN